MFVNLSLKHKDLLQEKLNVVDLKLSEYCFSNLFLFRKVHNYKVEFIDECIFIKGKAYDGKTFVMPCCNLDDSCDYYLDLLAKNLDIVDMLYPIPEQWLYLFPEDKFTYELNEGDMDYIYEKEKMQFYPGRKLQAKRNLVKQHRNLYDDRKVVFLKKRKDIKSAMRLLKKWQKTSPFTKKNSDYYPAMEALKNIEKLSLEGCIVFSKEK